MDSTSEGGQPTNRTLWARVASCLQPQEVFAIRRLVGEHTVSHNEALWREVGALEDVLAIAQEQNKELFDKLAARPVLSAGPDRVLLEQHVRLLLERLEGSNSPQSPSGWHSRPSAKDITWGFNGQGVQPLSASPGRPPLPLETARDRASYEYIKGSASSNSDPDSGLSPKSRLHLAGDMLGSRSLGPTRPGTGSSCRTSRPGTARTTRSAPDTLEGVQHKLNIAGIDDVLAQLRTAFEDEAKMLLGEVEDLTDLLEQEAESKLDAQRRARAGPTPPVQMADLKEFGKKLEDELRHQEHVEETLERLGRVSLSNPPTAVPGPRNDVPSISGGANPAACSPSAPRPASFSAGARPPLASPWSPLTLERFDSRPPPRPGEAARGGSGESKPVSRHSSMSGKLRGVVQQVRADSQVEDDDKYLN